MYAALKQDEKSLTNRRSGALNTIKQFKGDYEALSNFSECQIRMGGVYYPSVEHAYQAAKTIDKKERELFLNDNVTAGRAKRIGRTITIREEWDDIKVSVMRELCRQKYNIPKYQQILLLTGDALIQEGNNWNDLFWGVDLQSGVGNNNLGKILMAIRSDLQNPPKKFKLTKATRGDI